MQELREHLTSSTTRPTGSPGNQNMIQLKEPSQEEKNERIKNIMKVMGTETLDHNRISVAHIQQFADLLLCCEGLNADIFKNLARTRMGISERYVMEYYRAFLSWEVFRVHDKKIVLTDK